MHCAVLKKINNIFGSGQSGKAGAAVKEGFSHANQWDFALVLELALGQKRIGLYVTSSEAMAADILSPLLQWL